MSGIYSLIVWAEALIDVAKQVALSRPMERQSRLVEQDYDVMAVAFFDL